jgi:hypothetical protein
MAVTASAALFEEFPFAVVRPEVNDRTDDDDFLVGIGRSVSIHSDVEAVIVWVLGTVDGANKI